MITALWIAAAIFVAIVLFFGWALCAAAKRGDEMTEDCTEFEAHWLEKRP